MKFKIPPITQPIGLVAYAPEMEFHDDGSLAVVWAWVNPPAPLLNTYEALRARGQVALKKIKDGEQDEAAIRATAAELGEVGKGLYEFYAQIWSARTEPETHWTPAEVQELATNPENPALYGWLTDRTLELIRDFRAGLRKN